MVGLFACIPNFAPAAMGEAGTCMMVALDGEFSRNPDLCSVSSSPTAITLEAFALFEKDAHSVNSGVEVVFEITRRG